MAKKKINNVEAILAVQEARTDELLEKTNVFATGVGYKTTNGQDTDTLSVKVYVDGKAPLDEVPKADRIDPDYDGVPTDVEDMEPCVAFENTSTELEEFNNVNDGEIECELPEGRAESEASPLALRNRIRPAMGGYSIAHYRVTAGTIATCVRNQYWGSSGRNFYILSNNHVLANSNNARIGDPILQPGPYDGGRYPRDTIARLSRYIPIDFRPSGRNLVDAAIAQVDFANCTREVYWIGYMKAFMRRASIRPRMVVQKTGRTTEYTVGYIDAIHATVNVNYGSGRIARFIDQIIIKPGGFSAGGDSGSLILDTDENALGLLFAGSSTHTIANYIEHVGRLLRVSISERVV
jgi:hypothetical protein